MIKASKAPAGGAATRLALQPGECAVGVDGGSSSLKYSIRDSEGKLVHHECVGANPNLVGMDQFISHLGQGLIDALARAGLAAAAVVSAGFGLSGVDRPADIDALRRKLPILLPKLSRLWIGNDALPALRQGAGQLRGIVLIAGTGSICFGVGETGHMVRVGGWGGDLGDEGSGYWIGLRGLQIACRMADGRLAETPLLMAILKQLNMKSAFELIPFAYGRSRQEFKQATAALFPLVADHGAQGDPHAGRTMLLAMGHLTQHVVATEHRVREMDRRILAGVETQTNESDHGQEPGRSLAPGQNRMDLVCAGGLFGYKDFFERFTFTLKRKRDAFTPRVLREPASLGALELGLESPPLVPARG